MKQFFEQYGAVALGILALIVLIAMITPVGNIIKTSLQGTVQTFSTRIDNQTNTMTESMNAAFTNAVDFTGAKGGKYYAHGQVVADTTLPDGTNRGTEGWRLTDVQYEYLKNNQNVWNTDHTVVFFGMKNEGGSYISDKLVILDNSDVIKNTESGASVWRYKTKEMSADGSLNTLSRRHYVLFLEHDCYYGQTKILFNRSLNYFQENGGFKYPGIKADSCETLNLGCEVN